MYVPPYRVIARELGLNYTGSGSSANCWVSEDFLKFLLEKIVAQMPLSEEAYLNANPDVDDAMRKSGGPGARDHFAMYGYFEEREGAGPKFDEAYYLKNNKDVAAAVKAGEWSSGWAHYRKEGMFEWRSPSAAAEAEVGRWREVLSRVRAAEILPAA
jgi:hypothetical protein